MSMKDKVCIVTGGNSGIGLAVALRFAADGAKLAIIGRDEKKLNDATKVIQAEGAEVLPFAIDIADHSSVQLAVKSVLKQHGKVDVLVNSAGGGSLHKRTMTTTPEDMQRVLGANLLGTFYFIQAVLPSMLAQKDGTIINISSGAAVNPGLLGGMIYGASKAGVNNITEFLNAEFRNSGIRACVVLPGEVDTPALQRNRPIPPSKEALATMLTAEDVAETIYLAANLPARAHLQELRIRPTYWRDSSAETPKA